MHSILYHSDLSLSPEEPSASALPSLYHKLGISSKPEMSGETRYGP